MSSFRGAGKKLTPRSLDAAQKKLGRVIPAPYRKFLLENNGGVPERGEFEVAGQPVSVRAFLGIDGAEETWNLDYALETFGDRLPEGYFPIARDPGGNLVLLGPKGAVFFWDHDREANDGQPPTRRNLTRIAPNLPKFLAALS